MAKRKQQVKKSTQAPAAGVEREHMIAEAAYYLAEQRGFAYGDPAQDWYEAESKIDQLLAGQNADTRETSTI